MSSEILLFHLQHSSPHEVIIAAAEDRLEDAQIITENDPDALIGSQLFNVITAAMNQLRKEPNTELVERPVKVPDAADSITRYAGKIINNSLSRVPEKRKTLKFTSGPVRRLGTCALAEEKFVLACKERPQSTDEEPSRIYLNDSGDLAFLEKEEGEPSLMSFKSCAINGVQYAAGTLFSAQRNPDTKYVIVDGLNVALANPDNIQAIGPLRFSAFSFHPSERSEIFSVDSRYATTPIAPDIIQRATMSQLMLDLPDRKSLFEAFQKLR